MRHLQGSTILFKSMEERFLVLIWTEDSQIFKAEIRGGTLPVEDDVLNTAIGESIPENHIFPPWSDTLTEANQSLSHHDDVYVKKHYGALRDYSGTAFVTELFMAEVNVLEKISKNPHPNINEYLGCIRNGDLIGGICLRKCVCTLEELVDVQGKVSADQVPPFLPDVLINGIKAAIDHLHSLELVHDDINPSNIMIDAAGNPILIDFDSCVAVGSKSRGGTPGWAPNKTTIAKFENDTYAFELVAKYVRGEYDGQDYDFEDDNDVDVDGAP